MCRVLLQSSVVLCSFGVFGLVGLLLYGRMILFLRLWLTHLIRFATLLRLLLLAL